MPKTLHVDITPDTSLVDKLGAVGYTTEEAIAELVDNAVDARIKGSTERVSIRLDFESRQIEVADDGTGMDEDELTSAMTIAKSSKEQSHLGQFGIGLKSACSALSAAFSVRTSKRGSGMEYTTMYDVDEWSGGGRSWKDLPITVRRLGSDEAWHGTVVTITRIKVPLYPSQAMRFRERFGTRYAAYLKDRQVSIRVNTKYCEPSFPDVEPKSRMRISLKLPENRKVRGYVELLKKRSIGGGYGMDLYRHGRLISTNEKFGILAHPELARVVGRLDMDDVPVNFYKNSFLKESREYAEVKDAFHNDDTVKLICKLSRSKTKTPKSAIPVFTHVFDGKDIPGGLPPRVRTNQALEALASTGSVAVGARGESMRVTAEPAEGPVYSMAGPDGPLALNTASNAFRLAGNPLFLAGMFAIEAKLARRHPQTLRFLRDRNLMLDELSKKFNVTRKRVSNKRAAVRPHPRGYGIVNELVDIHDFLEGYRTWRFQFTALSTLAPYMHHMRDRLVYSLYVDPSDAEDVAGLLREKFDKFAFALDPGAKELETLSLAPGINRIMVIRGYRSIRGGTAAKPEKALVDLVTESHTYGLPLDMGDIRHICENMDREGLLDRKKIRTHAMVSKKEPLLKTVIGGMLK